MFTLLLSSAQAHAADSWKEEVLLHDGQKIIVERSQTYGGRHEVGQSEPEKTHTIRFTLPNTNAPFSWTSEYGDEVGRTNFNLLALHIKEGIPYLVVEPNLCLSYNKWGRPNPPYLFFKWVGSKWEQVAIAVVPAEFKTINLIVNTGRQFEINEGSKSTGYVPYELVLKINENLRQPEYKTIFREPVTYDPECIPMITNGKGLWRASAWFEKKMSLEACEFACKSEKFEGNTCPCANIFNVK